MLACQLAKSNGLDVIATTRNETKSQLLIDNGADLVLIDQGEIKNKLYKKYPKGVHKVLELVGTNTLKDSLKCLTPKGVLCMTGILGNEWTMSDFTPMGDISSLRKLTVYMGEAENLSKESLQTFIAKFEQGAIRVTIDRVFNIRQIPEAHQYMEDNLATGKLVVEV